MFDRFFEKRMAKKLSKIFQAHAEGFANDDAERSFINKIGDIVRRYDYKLIIIGVGKGCGEPLSTSADEPNSNFVGVYIERQSDDSKKPRDYAVIRGRRYNMS